MLYSTRQSSGHQIRTCSHPVISHGRAIIWSSDQLRCPIPSDGYPKDACLSIFSLLYWSAAMQYFFGYFILFFLSLMCKRGGSRWFFFLAFLHFLSMAVHLGASSTTRRWIVAWWAKEELWRLFKYRSTSAWETIVLIYCPSRKW